MQYEYYWSPKIDTNLVHMTSELHAYLTDRLTHQSYSGKAEICNKQLLRNIDTKVLVVLMQNIIL